MAQGNGIKIAGARRLLVERVAASRYLNRSARLRDLLIYLADRVLEGDAAEIHEQEVGHKVFGRPRDYDTSSDNIVRVHASMLRKRLEQYFAAEGASEPVIIEIPKGNYAPVFRDREEPLVEPLPLPDPEPALPPAKVRRAPWIWIVGGLALLFATTTAYLLLHQRSTGAATAPPGVALFWSEVFRPDRATDIVLDDASVGLYQDLTGRNLGLSGYFDRDYLRTLPNAAAAANLDEKTVASIVLRRQSSFAGVNFLWKLFQIPGAGGRRTMLRFARDYSFRDLKADNAVLIGNSRVNLWMEPFEPKIGLRWMYDKENGAYFPVDSWSGGKVYQEPAKDTHEGYFAIALLPNLGSTGNVLLISGTGGSAINAGADFLSDEASLAALRRKLPPSDPHSFPHFEALVRVKGRSTLPRDAVIVICRPPK